MFSDLSKTDDNSVIDISQGMSRHCDFDLPCDVSGSIVMECDKCGNTVRMHIVELCNSARTVRMACYAHILLGKPCQ